ncbi:MAG: hypothetical protein HYW65_02480 [Candidatus Liptonbacteria bacterium]|nr:hypothetical protein [Candidatus Liptonbacteria bacterium]
MKEKLKRTTRVAVFAVALYIQFNAGAQNAKDMVRISGGTFTMGSPSNEQGRDGDEVRQTSKAVTATRRRTP